MNYELTVNIGNRPTTVFIQNGFDSIGIPSQHRHKHNYTEMHVVLGDTSRFYIRDRAYDMKSGDVFLIPADTLHDCLSGGERLRHTAFQIDVPAHKFLVRQVSEEILYEFFKEIERCRFTQSFSKIASFISLICADFCPESEVRARTINDYYFIIYEFFSNRYNEDLTLSNLAEELHLSEKQADRLVVKCTGNTFRQELISRRMTIAEHLLREGKMPISEIARYVGYQSYSGFWKAYKKYSNK